VLGPSDGQFLLRIYREGLASAIGHDLVLELSQWSAEVDVSGGPSGEGSRVVVRLDLGSLGLVSSSGVTPLSDSERSQILTNAAKTLDTRSFREAVFASTRVDGSPAEGGTIEGMLTLHGATGAVAVDVRVEGEQLVCRATVSQRAFGIRPYSGLLGTLKVRDAVDIELTARMA
jgi:hypothetical protein